MVYFSLVEHLQASEEISEAKVQQERRRGDTGALHSPGVWQVSGQGSKKMVHVL